MREMCLTAAFAALAFFSCTKEMEVPTPQKEQQPEAEKVWTVTVEAARGVDDLTKAVLTGDGWIEEEADAATKGLELEGNYLKSTWDFKEKVFVYKGTALVGELESAATLARREHLKTLRRIMTMPGPRSRSRP